MDHHLHLYGPNDVLDIASLILFCVSAYSTCVLINRYRKHHDEWNVKTLDSWYALFMWSLGGCVFIAQSIALDRPLTPAFVFLTAGILVTAKAVHKKGDWGGRDT